MKEPEKEPKMILDDKLVNSKKSAPANNKPLNILLVLSLSSVTVLAILAICIANNVFGNRTIQQGDIAKQSQTMPTRQSEHKSMPNSSATQHESSTDQSTSNRISGVVTSVADNSFVVGGNGTEYTVKTSDKTTYNITSKIISVNDSVVISGALSGNIITATRVMVTNR